MNQKPIDLTKPLQTRDGRKVRLFCADCGYEKPVLAQIENLQPTTWPASGRLSVHTECASDLVNVPEKRVVWVNFYDPKHDVDPDECQTREEADGAADYQYAENNRTRIACVKVEFTEGEGL